MQKSNTMSRVLSEQEIVRRESLQKLIDLGINPYPSESLDVNTTSKQIKSKYLIIIQMEFFYQMGQETLQHVNML